jgi:hypothetical protein
MSRIILSLITVLIAISIGHSQNKRFNKQVYKSRSLECFYTNIFPSCEIIGVNSLFLIDIFKNKGIPIVHPNPVSYISSIGYLRNRIYSNANWTYAIGDYNKNDSLKSELMQYSFSFTLGYNIHNRKREWEKTSRHDSIIKKKEFSYIISTYLGIRTFRLRYLISENEKKINLNNYLDKPGYDIRAIQVSWPIGINVTFIFDDLSSLNFNISYLCNFDNQHPLIRAPQGRIRDSFDLPFRNFAFSIGYGFGMNKLQ